MWEYPLCPAPGQSCRVSSNGKLVKESFKTILPIAGIVVEEFYETLFEQHPEVRSMFPSDMSNQRLKLVQALALVGGHADRIDDVAPALKNLGVKHVAYGVEPEHYGAVKEALMATLDKMLGEGFTPELREAWSETIDAVAGHMLDGHYSVVAA